MLTFGIHGAIILFARCVMRKCRNWQTSKTKDLVVVTPCGFKSHLPQENKRVKPKGLILLFCAEELLNPGFRSPRRRAPSSVGSAGKRSPGPFSLSASPHLPLLPRSVSFFIRRIFRDEQGRSPANAQSAFVGPAISVPFINPLAPSNCFYYNGLRDLKVEF